MHDLDRIASQRLGHPGRLGGLAEREDIRQDHNILARKAVEGARDQQSRQVGASCTETSFTEEVRQRIAGIHLVLLGAHENICAATSRTFGPLVSDGSQGGNIGDDVTGVAASADILCALDALLGLALEHRDLAASLNRKL